MAEPGSASNDAAVPASSSSAAALPDWEMLSMSMSASALAKPDAGSLNNDKPHPDNPNPQTFQENPNPDATFASDASAADSLHAGVNRDGSVDIVAEPFTEGWKPYPSPSSSLHAYGSEYGSEHGTETFYSTASMVAPQGSSVSAKEDAGVLSYAHSDDVEFEHVSPKTRSKGGKRPKKSSRVVWSIAVAATMVGIAILGHRWRLACRDNQQLRLELSAKDERLNDLLYQVNRLKDIVGGYHRAPVARSSSL